ncbi:dihydropteroate synthase [Bartonella sp. LJL80]
MMTKWKIGGGNSITLSETAIIMGILNVTPDSFSDGGAYVHLQNAIDHADHMILDGAHIIDIGGESTRPGFDVLHPQDEQQRVLPVIEALHGLGNALLSIDTYHAKTAEKSIQAGAHIVNDVWGLQKDDEMANIIAQSGAGIVVMHNSRDREVKSDLIEDQKFFFDLSLNIASKAGISDDAIVLDPGFGFGKDAKQNLEIMRRASELHCFGKPLLAATSRKRFLGAITGHENARQRDVATSATSVILRQAGFSIFRVHDVGINRDALAVIDALLMAKGENP